MNLDALITLSPALVLVTPLITAFLKTILEKIDKRMNKIVFASGLFLTFFFVFLMSYQVLVDESWIYVFGAEEPSSGSIISQFRINFVADGYSVLASITLVVVALASGIYSFDFIERRDDKKFYTLFLLTLAGATGMVLTRDLFNLFVWYEVASVASCGLIVFYNERGKSIEAGLKYMILSTVGGLFFLFSIGLIYGQYGVLNLAVLSDTITGTFNDKLALGIVIGVLAMKSSSVPFHMWAPDAYGEAPGSVSPFIAVTSLGSLFVLIRLLFDGLLGGIAPLQIGIVLMVLGIVSMTVGIGMALVEKDLKRLVAYLSISQIGYILLAVSVGFVSMNSGELDSVGITAMRGGLFHMINDGIYKALLFFSVISIVYLTGSRNVDKISGLAWKNPALTTFFIIGGLCIAAVPPSSGFYSKYLIYKSTFLFNPVLGMFTVTMSIIIFGVMVKVFYEVFLGPPEIQEKENIPLWMSSGMVLLTIGVLIFSIIPHRIVSEVVIPAVEALL